MHYKAVVNKDGSVSTLTKVDDSFTPEGKRIYYIEADSLEDASAKLTKILAAKYDAAAIRASAAAAARLTSRAAEHRCRACARKLPKTCTKTRCDVCRARMAERERALYNGAPRLVRLPARTLEEKAAATLRFKARAVAFGKSCGGTRAVTLRAVLVQFDRRTPAGFRRWLVNEITRLSTPKPAAAALTAQPQAAE